MTKCIYCGSEEDEEYDNQIICKNCGRTKASANVVSSLNFDNCNVTGNFGNKGGDYTKVPEWR